MMVKGVMIAMSPTITLKGGVKFSVKKLIAGGEMASSTYTGPGELLLAPPFIGDLSTIRLNGHETWNVGKDSYIACTQGVIKDYKNQGFSKAMFSGEGLFVMKVSGAGILWVASFGAIIRKDVSHARKSAVGSILIPSLVAGWRKVYHRQWSFGGVELQICPRTGSERRYPIGH